MNAGQTVYKNGNAYTFEAWADVPPSSIKGRVALLRWDFNGTPASGWEADLKVPCATCGDPAHAVCR